MSLTILPAHQTIFGHSFVLLVHHVVCSFCSFVRLIVCLISKIRSTNFIVKTFIIYEEFRINGYFNPFLTPSLFFSAIPAMLIYKGLKYVTLKEQERYQTTKMVVLEVLRLMSQLTNYLFEPWIVAFFTSSNTTYFIKNISFLVYSSLHTTLVQKEFVGSVQHIKLI